MTNSLVIKQDPRSITHRRVITAFLALALVFLQQGCTSTVLAGTMTVSSATPGAIPTTASTLANPGNTPSATWSTPAAEATFQPPVQLTFPAASPEPANDWRAPLYPVPLALNPNDHFYLARPVPIEHSDEPLPDYRYGYIMPETTTMHTGTDIVEPLHTPILAAADGKVVFAGYGLLNGNGDKDDPYGLAVVIRHNISFHNRTILTVYAHMEKTTVTRGEWVKAGDQIGYVGLTGATTGPHLHIEVRLEINDQEYQIQNPELWMVPPIGDGVLAGRIMSTGGALLGERQVWVKSLDTQKTWSMYTYSTRMTHVDPYYRENLVLSDLPAGKYEVSFYYYRLVKQVIEIHPGAVTYFQFWGSKGFTIGDPPPSNPDEFLGQN